MNLNKYQWAAVAAALAAPSLYFLFKDHVKNRRISIHRLKNLSAFLLMIQYAEGTIGPNAYRMMYGGQLLNDYSRHPNKAITRNGITSTAAGAYQFLYSTWAGLQKDLKLPDFSPSSQNRGAIELIKRRGALEDVFAGRFTLAIYKCRKEWASLPGAGYGQQERSMKSLALVYVKAGGNLTAA
jgi:muramidase (phage lysozyme)